MHSVWRWLMYGSLFGVSFFLPLGVLAQEELRLMTSPLPINLVTIPGQSVSTELRLKNDSAKSEWLMVSPMKFKAYAESGKPELMESESRDEFLKWVTFSEDTFLVAPNEWKTITATFHVPETAAFGYYYAFVFSRAEEHQPLTQSETRLVGGAATLVLLEVQVPEAKREVKIAHFSTDHLFYEFLPTTFTVALENTGNVHVAPRGNIFIDQGEKHDIALLEVNPHQGNILPASKRVFEAVWDDGFPVYKPVVQDGHVVLDQEGKEKLKLQWNWQEAAKLRFGKYTAKLLLVYDDGTRDVPLEGMVTFWVVPWRLLVGILFNIGLVIGLILYVIRLRRRLKLLEQPMTSF